MDATKVCVLVDGVALRVSNNISESYNALLQELRHRGAAVIPTADFVQCTVSTWSGIVWLEPALTPSALLPLVLRRVKALAKQRVRLKASPLAAVLVADDVYHLRGAARAAQHLGAAADDVCDVHVALWTMFPRECYVDADDGEVAAALQRFGHRVWPHVAAPVWFEAGGAPATTAASRHSIVMFGQRDAARYPERAAAAAHGCVVCGDVPDYPARRRVAPETMRDAARAAGAVFVGGGERHAPVAKHIEFAAAGIPVIYTDRATVDAVARTFGVHCAVLEGSTELEESRDAVCSITNAVKTVAHVRAAHTAPVRVDALLEWFCHASSKSSLAPSPSSPSSSCSASASSSSSLPPAPARACARDAV